jgi:hypothetical protein
MWENGKCYKGSEIHNSNYGTNSNEDYIRQPSHLWLYYRPHKSGNLTTYDESHFILIQTMLSFLYAYQFHINGGTNFSPIQLLYIEHEGH